MVKYSLIPDYIRFATRSLFILKKLLKNRQLKPAELREFQNKKLKSLIKHSLKHVPYYRALFKKARISANEIKSIEDLRKIPVSHKDLFVSQPIERLVSNNSDLSKCFKWRTAGTTGLTLSTYRELNVRLLDHLLAARWQLECGTGFTDRRVSIGLDYLVNPLLFTFKKAIALSPRISLESQIKKTVKFKPRVLLGYPSSLWILSKELIDRDILDLNIETIYTSGELLDENTRRLYRDVLGGDTYDGYGAIEVGGICTECVDHSGYHIWADSVIVEIIKNDEQLSPGEEGEIVVTHLENYAMPFIRYNLRDLGLILKEEPSCGNRLPLMRITSGRPQYVTELPGNERIPAWELVSFLLFVQGVKRFKLFQKDLDEFVIHIVRSESFTNETVKEIKQRFVSQLKLRFSQKRIENINIKVEVVSHIPKDKSGKFQIFEVLK
jgi:phenylacetate-CoA ligase